jgi:protein SCO1/2
MDLSTDDTAHREATPSTPPGPERPQGGSGPNAVPVPGSSRLTEADRAAAFSSGRAPVDRTAAFRAGSVPIPRKFVLWVIAGFAVLGIGGIIAEHLVGNSGVESVISTPPTTLAGTGGPPSTAPAPVGPAVAATPTAVIGLKRIAPGLPPALHLTDQNGSPWTLADARGKVVVLTFLNAECNDVCPVLGQEIVQAHQLLGSRASSVAFVVVNTDPLETSLTVTPPALSQTGLGSLPDVTFLTGSLTDLGQVWREYGVSVAVSNITRLVSHTDVMYFIGPSGRFAQQATPFGNEDTLGVYSLDPTTIHTFARGVAAAAGGLIGAPR